MCKEGPAKAPCVQSREDKSAAAERPSYTYSGAARRRERSALPYVSYNGLNWTPESQGKK